MRAALDDWMTRTGDLGLVPERELQERMRPGGVWQTAATPVADPPGGRFRQPVDFTLSCATPGATVVFRPIGGDGRWLLYKGPIRLAVSTALRAKCARLGFQDSAELRVDYDLTP
jgi:hypothetical protein